MEHGIKLECELRLPDTQVIRFEQHKQEYRKTEEGHTFYYCLQCGETSWEFSESHGG